MATVGDIARAIEKVTDAIMLWVKSGDSRRMRSAVDIADRIFKRYRQLNPNGDKTIEKWINEFYDRLI